MVMVLGSSSMVVARCTAFSSLRNTAVSPPLSWAHFHLPRHQHYHQQHLATTTTMFATVVDAIDDDDGVTSSLLSSSLSPARRRRSFLLRQAALVASAVMTTTSTTNSHGGFLPIRPALAAVTTTPSSSISTAATATNNKNPSSLIGHVAPNFELPNTNGQLINLDALTSSGTKWTVLYFYPAAFTSGCTLEARKFQELSSQFTTLNTRITGISVDDISTNIEFCSSENLDFYLLSDNNGTVSKLYNTALSVPLIGTFANRQTYILDPNKVVRAIFTNVEGKIVQHPQEVLDKLIELQK
jgi:peroxiredoxin Q/BCP